MILGVQISILGMYAAQTGFPYSFDIRYLILIGTFMCIGGFAAGRRSSDID